MKNMDNSEIREFLEKIEGNIEQAVLRIDVLEKVKHLFTIPGTDTMTTPQVAAYYGVDIDTIRRVYQRHKAEIDSDGTMMKKAEDFLNRTGAQFEDDGLTEPNVQSKDGGGVTEPKVTLGCDGVKVYVKNTPDFCKAVVWPELGVEIKVSNRGVRVFSRRAVLRIGMLMPGSKVATEVRTQLLNVFEKVPATVAVEDIDREIELRRRVGECIAEGRYAEAFDYISQLTKYLDQSKENAFID